MIKSNFENIKKWLKGFFSQNLGVKIICLVLATSFWLYASASQTKTGIFPVAIPIEAKNTPDNLTSSYNEKNVSIKIIADYSVWSGLSADSFEAYVDLSNLEKGTHEISVNVRSKVVGVQIVDKSPDKIFVTLSESDNQKVQNKTVGVYPLTNGQPADGYWVEKISVSPATVTLTGEAQVLVDINKLATKEINIAGLNAPITRAVVLDLPSGVKTVDEIGTVMVMIKISPFSNIIQTSASINPQNIESTLDIVSITPISINIALSGDSAALSNIDNVSINYNLDLIGKTEGAFDIILDKANFVLPTGVTVVNFLPISVKVELKKR